MRELAARVAHTPQPSLRINTVAVSEALRGHDAAAAVDVELPTLLKTHLASVAAAFNATLSPRTYVAHNREQWAANQRQLLLRAVRGSPSILQNHASLKTFSGKVQ